MLRVIVFRSSVTSTLSRNNAVVQHLRTRQCTCGETFSIVTSCYSGRRRKSIVGASELQFSDRLCAEVLF
jgi:hypothetical protein